MEEFKPIETQEQFDEVLDKMIGKRLARNTRQVEEKFADYLSPEDFKTKTEELTKQIAELQDKLKKSEEDISANANLLAEKENTIKQYEIGSVKTKIAAEMGFSLDAIDFLSGDNEDSIRESAEALKSLMGTKTAPLANPEGASVNSEQAALKGMLNNLF